MGASGQIKEDVLQPFVAEAVKKELPNFAPQRVHFWPLRCNNETPSPVLASAYWAAGENLPRSVINLC